MAKTITYVNQADGKVLDREVTDSPMPCEGQPVMFLEQDGIYQVREVRRISDDKLDALVNLIRKT